MLEIRADVAIHQAAGPAGVGAAGYRMARQAMADKAISDAGDAGLSFLRDRLSRVPRGGADLWPLCLAALPDAGRRKPRAGGPQSWLRRSGPKEFLRHHWYVEAANRARLVVVQVLSARSIENSHFDNPNADLLRAKGNPEAKLQHSEPAYDQLLRTESRSYVEALVAETRRRYVEEMRRLLRAIEVPKLLFWFSQRKPDDQEKLDYVGNLFHHFPQLVNRAMIE